MIICQKVCAQTTRFAKIIPFQSINSTFPWIGLNTTQVRQNLRTAALAGTSLLGLLTNQISLLDQQALRVSL